MDLFQISSILIFFASLGFGFFVYTNDRKAPLNKAWFLFSAFVGLWGLSLYGVTAAISSDVALRWQYILDASGIFVPVLYLYFVSTLLSLKNGRTLQGILAAALLLVAFSVTPFFKEGVVPTFGFFWIDPGPYYFVFPLFFGGLVVYSLYLLITAYGKNNDLLRHSQIKYQILASVIGFSGGVTNFLPQLFGIYPFGNYFILLYVFFISYSILRYKLFNVKTVATELFAGGVVILFLFNLLSSAGFADWLIKFLLFVLVLFFSVLMVRGVFKEIEARAKIEKLAEDLTKANTRLKELDQQKSEFVSIASHQLRSPLTAIKGYTSMILEGSFGATEPKVKEAVGRVFESSKHLAAVVEDLLNVSKIEQGGMKFEFGKVDFGKIAKEIVEDLRPNAESAGITLRIADDGKAPYYVNADYEKLRQVALNLIDNAIKYTPKGEVDAFMARDTSKGTVTFSVKDSGIGVPKELQDRLFEKFSRGTGISKINTGGSGLGLYLVKEIVKAHGGRVWVESPGEGKGSVFFAELKAL